METLTQLPPAGYKGLHEAKKLADNIYGRAFSTIFHYLLSSFKGEKGEIMEFGTFHGYSAALIAQFMKRLRMTQNHLHLFDSFTGLPDIDNPIDLTHYEVSKGIWFKGEMDLVSSFPQIENIIFRELTEIISSNQLSIIKGYYEDTIDEYFSNIQKNAKLFLLISIVICILHQNLF